MEKLQGTTGQRQGWAARGWEQLVAKVGGAQPRCIRCGKLRGECRCVGEGNEHDGMWFYYSNNANWVIPRPALMALTEGDLDVLHPNTAANIRVFINYLLAP